MRRIYLLPFAALAAAACQDQPTGPETPVPVLAKSPAEGAPPITLIPSAPRVLGHTVGDAYRYHNRPDPDIGGDRVVWRYAANPYYGDVQVYQTLASTGAQTLLSSGSHSGPRTSGRYTTWQDGVGAIVVLDNATGQRRRIEGQFPLSASVEIAGDRLAYMDVNAQTVSVYDIPTGVSRTVVRYGSGTSYDYVRDIGFDGRYLAWISDGGMGVSGLGMAIHDTQTGQERVAVPFGQGFMTGPSVDRGRVVFSMDADGQHPVFLYDIASGSTRRLSNAPRAQQYPEISGDLVVWEDTRNDPHQPYVFNYDVYLYDLRAGVEMPLANGPEWTSAPHVDGTRVVYTQRRENRWEVMLVELAPASLPGLREELRRAVAAGAVRNQGLARSLENVLAQAASAGSRARTEERLRHFAAQVRQHAGKQIDAAAARRLEGMAAGVIARL